MKCALALLFCFSATSLVACGSSEHTPGDAAGSGGHAGGGAGGGDNRGGGSGSVGHGGSGGQAGGAGGHAGTGGDAHPGTGGGQAGSGAGGHAGGGGQGGSGAGGHGPGGNGGSNGGGGSGGAAAFAPVQAIFDQYCVRCHDPAHPVVPETQTYVGMPLVASASYAALVGVPALETCGGNRVVAGDPEHSYLYRKVVDATPCDGERMPHQGMLANTPPLSAADIATIRNWIAAGAHP